MVGVGHHGVTLVSSVMSYGEEEEEDKWAVCRKGKWASAQEGISAVFLFPFCFIYCFLLLYLKQNRIGKVI